MSRRSGNPFILMPLAAVVMGLLVVAPHRAGASGQSPSRPPGMAACGNELESGDAAAVLQCCGDCEGDGLVTINNLISAVGSALTGCPPAPPVPMILGRYEGQGLEAFSGCLDPEDNGIFPLPVVAVEISEQDGATFSGTLSGVDDDGAPFSVDITGVVDGGGELTGSFSDASGVSGTFSGTVVGRLLAVAVAVREAEPGDTCDAAASGLLSR